MGGNGGKRGTWVVRGIWHDVWLYCCPQLAAPIGLSPPSRALSLNPLPPQGAVPIGLSPPCAPPLPAWPTYPRHPSFPLEGCAKKTEPPDFPVSLLRAGSTRRLATALAVGQGRPNGHPMRWGTPPRRRLSGPGMSTYRVTFPNGAQNYLPPVRDVHLPSDAIRRSMTGTAPPPAPAACAGDGARSPSWGDGGKGSHLPPTAPVRLQNDPPTALKPPVWPLDRVCQVPLWRPLVNASSSSPSP